MGDIAERFENNPILTPRDFNSSIDEFHVAGVLTPGAFTFKRKNRSDYPGCRNAGASDALICGAHLSIKKYWTHCNQTRLEWS